MFQFGGFPLHKEQRVEARLEVLFGYLRIRDCMRLPGAYRSLPRPSSALKPSHPSHSVVTSKHVTGPTAGVGAYTRRHRRVRCPLVAAMPFTPDISFGSCIF